MRLLNCCIAYIFVRTDGHISKGLILFIYYALVLNINRGKMLMLAINIIYCKLVQL